MKKILALIALVLTFSLIFASCDKNDNVPSEEDSNTNLDNSGVTEGEDSSKDDDDDTEVTTGSLAFTSNGDGTCYVSGVIGTCKDENIIIPSVSPSGDKVTAIGSYAF